MQTRIIFFPRHFQSGFQRVFKPFLSGFQSVSKHFEVPGIASNILRNKSALVTGICTCTISTCFQTLRPRKLGSLHKTGFSLPHQYCFDGQSSSKLIEPRFRLLQIDIGESTSFVGDGRWRTDMLAKQLVTAA